MQSNIKANIKSKPVYIRLHRTPVLIKALSAKQESKFDKSIMFKSKKSAEHILFASGPHMLNTALEIQSLLSKKDKHIDVVAIVEITQKMNYKLEKYNKVFCLEDNLRDTGIGSALALSGEKKIVRIGVSNFYQSTRTFIEMQQQHNLDLDSVYNVVRKAISCNSH